jgi:DNA ligase-1
MTAKVFPTLYKIGGKGQHLEWTISVSEKLNNGNSAGLITIARGQHAGKITESNNVITKGKCIGKKNETTPFEQALLEAESRWKKQHRKSYRETLEEAQEAACATNKAMLAHRWREKKDKYKIGEEVATQPKLDGMRCMATKKGDNVFLTSREGDPIESVPHVNNELLSFLDEGQTWDGELYVHGMEFEKLLSICKRGAKNLHPEYETMQAHFFDVVGPESFWVRGEPLACHRPPSDIVKIVKTNTMIVSETFEEEIHQALKIYESEGYEGLMVRKTDMPYEHKRTDQLVKVKSFEDAEFRIVGYEDGEAGSTKANLLQTFVFTINDNVNPDDDFEFWENLTPKERTRFEKEHLVFKASCFGKEPILREMWGRRDEYVGEWATVCYQEKTKYDNPRFGKVKAIRGREVLCQEKK